MSGNTNLTMYKNDCLKLYKSSYCFSVTLHGEAGMIALVRRSQLLILLAFWLVSHDRRGSMSSYYDPLLNNIIIHKIIFVHHYTIKIVHSYFDIYNCQNLWMEQISLKNFWRILRVQKSQL